MASEVTVPNFTYYTPAALLAVTEASDAACDVCGQARGIRYTGPFYSIADDPCICPHCIADGSAAKRFDGQFNDIVIEWEDAIINQEAAKISPTAVDELLHRTPGYISWQGNTWMFHCADGAVFEGDAFSDEIDNASEATRLHWEAANGLAWDRVMHPSVRYQHMGVYRFKCRHCELVMFHWDRT
jgi:uncharacterized protein CbrC (UPF0167 family)